MPATLLKFALSLGAVGAIFAIALGSAGEGGLDTLLGPEGLCGAPTGGQPALLRHLILAKTETAPFRAVPAQGQLDAAPVLYQNLGKLHFAIESANPKAQAYVDQGLLFAIGFNHAEAQRAFREAQRLDVACAMCFWGEALVLGPNINAPMFPEANEPALAALARAQTLGRSAPVKERALIEALSRRYSVDPKADRAALDTDYAQAMKEVASRFPGDDTVKMLYAEALMDTQAWDYWEAAGARPKGHATEIVATLEEVLARNPDHPGAVHMYLHVMEASNAPEKALPHARRLASLAPGVGHLVHMPAHIYYRLGMYRESVAVNKRAIAVDERYFKTSPSDPLYRAAYYPHNIHFVMVSAQMGGDGPTALEAAAKLDAAISPEMAKKFAFLEPVKASPYTTHAQFSDPAVILALKAPPDDLILVKAMYHYARALAYAAKKEKAPAQAEIDALGKMERAADFKPFAEWALPAKEIVQTARLVATARLAASQGNLEAAARAYEEAIFIEDTLAYMEPPYWYYPVRQSLGAVRLRQGKLEEAEKAFRDSLAQARNNGWALAGLAQTYRAQGDAKAEKAARAAFSRAWLGDRAYPKLDRL
ncbi:MAG TPA: hypothetical protein VN878_08805 [Usitatibacter sp.]|nr:hypothetical protein [Usitatibacter sp.]